MHNWIWFLKNRCRDIWVFSSSACGFITGGLRNAGLTWSWPPWVHSPPSCRGSRRGSDTASPLASLLEGKRSAQAFCPAVWELGDRPTQPSEASLKVRESSGGMDTDWPHCTCGLSIMVFRFVLQGLHSRGPQTTWHHVLPGLWRSPRWHFGLIPWGPEAEFLRTPPSLIGSVQMWAPTSPWKWPFFFFFFDTHPRGQTLSLSWSCWGLDYVLPQIHTLNSQPPYLIKWLCLEISSSKAWLN